LRVISESPSDAAAVFRAIVRQAVRLCGADSASVRVVEGDVVRMVAHHPPSIGAYYPGPPMHVREPGTMHARVLAERRTLHVPALAAAFPDNPQVSNGVRAVVALPLLRGDEAIGVLYARRTEPRAFTDPQIKLLEGFAAQAVIAIENARLFQELSESNAT